MGYEETYDQWIKDPFIDEEDKKTLQSIKENKTLIEELFYQDLSFGTAGMRGKIGIGTNRINKYQVAKATQAFSAHLNASGVGDAGIVIAYDTRHKSREFAETAAKVFLGNNISVYLFKDVRPVPELSFAVRYLKTAGGIVITASHNPKTDNGYKLYSDYGGQLVPEDMRPIIKAFSDIDSFNKIKIYKGNLKTHSLYSEVGDEIDEAYYKEVLKLRTGTRVDKEVKIVYSPLHGTGITCVPEILRRSGLNNLNIVEEQNNRDSNFSTVKAPNPENKEALDMSLILAKKIDADLVMATDPDCDRVGIAVRDQKRNYLLLNGNQIGALLLDYLIQYSAHIPEKAVMIQTVVTSNLGKRIAESAGIEVMEVLTGFKYIGEKITQFEKQQSNAYIFGYEESYGYLSGTHARDKDAVNACLLLAEMAACYKLQGKTIYDRLAELYEQFGFYYEILHNVRFDTVNGMEKMRKILTKLRENPLSEIDGEIVSITDYLKDETGLPEENVLKYKMKSDSWVAIRPSGTEPKLKLYFSSVAKSEKEAKEKCERMKQEITKLLKI